MNKNELQKKREELESKLERLEKAHCTKYNMNNPGEGAYRDSCKKNHEVYLELSEVCKQLGDPIPMRI
jgi:hypothetical protein